MTAKTFLTISSIFAILYGLGFLLLPGPSIAMYGTEPEPHLILVVRYFGSALLAFGVLEWFGKDFRDWEAVRGCSDRSRHPKRSWFAADAVGHG